MSDPATISGERVLIAEPQQNWERVEMPICEGPQVLRRNGDLFIVYSASASWTADYCLGMLHNNTTRHAQSRQLAQARSGVPKDRPGLGRGPLLVREITLPD